MPNIDKSGSNTDGVDGQEGEDFQSMFQSMLQKRIIDQFGPDEAERFQPILPCVVSEIVKLIPPHAEDEASEARANRREEALKEREQKLNSQEGLVNRRKELIEKDRATLDQQTQALEKEQKNLQQKKDNYTQQSFDLEQAKNQMENDKVKFETARQQLNSEREKTKVERETIEKDRKAIQQLTDKYHAQDRALQERNRLFEIEKAKFETGKQQLNSEREKTKAEREKVEKDYDENLRISGELEKKSELVIKAELDAKLKKEAGERILAGTIELQKKFWPDCFLLEEWNDWRDTIQQQANTDANAALLLAALHAYYAASRSDKLDLVFDALRRVGVCLYPQFAVEAERIAQAFNETANVRFRLKVPKTGQPTDSIWMNFKPGVSSVTEVLSWAVFDFEGRVSHRALVK